MKTRLLLSTCLLCCCLSIALKSNAQWSTDANVDNALNATIYDPLTFCSDGHGGAFFTWSQTFTGQTHDIIVNRIDSLGYLHFGDSGKLIRRNSKGFTAPNICEDGHGGCYVAFGDEDLPGQPIICHHIDANGNKLWSSNGKQVTVKLKSQYYQTYVQLLNDDGDGVMLAFITNIAGSDTCSTCNVGPSGLYAQRLSYSSGTRKWGVNGKLIEGGSDERAPAIVRDGYDGITVMWSNYSYEGQGFNYSLRMNRLDHNGQLRFTAGSRKLNTLAGIGFGPAYRITFSKNKNYIAVWNSDGIGHKELYAQKIDLSGNWLWGSSEIKFRDTTGEVRYPNLVSDNYDGAFVTWLDGRKVNVSYGVYAQHLNAAGVKQFASQGKAIDTASSGNIPQILTDTASGFKVFWITSADNRMHTQEVKKTGSFRLAGIGPALSAAGHYPLSAKTVLAVPSNHDILFLRLNGGGKCYAKYVPLGSVLPLTFLNFSGTNAGKANMLNWQTANEINTSYFSLERSDNGNSFYEIAKVKAHNTVVTNDYNYEDYHLSNNAYYRVKEVDADNKYNYSKVIAISSAPVSSMHIAPNPAVKFCTVYFNELPDENSFLKLVDISGRQQKQMKLTAQQSSAVLDVSALQPGIYFCAVTIKGKPSVQKIVVAR